MYIYFLFHNNELEYQQLISLNKLILQLNHYIIVRWSKIEKSPKLLLGLSMDIRDLFSKTDQIIRNQISLFKVLFKCEKINVDKWPFDKLATCVHLYSLSVKA